MSDYRKLLFICTHNIARSPTAEALFLGVLDYEARSAGTDPDARVRVTAGHIRWADVIFVMERDHVQHLEEQFPTALQDRPVVCLKIPDVYEYMEPVLVQVLRLALNPHLRLPRRNGR
jgi:predicted protein tyrosine phosphatase